VRGPAASRWLERGTQIPQCCTSQLHCCPVLRPWCLLLSINVWPKETSSSTSSASSPGAASPDTRPACLPACRRSCRAMVHQACYGVAKPPLGGAWMCDTCGIGLTGKPPPCALCPMAGGAVMKRTQEGRWAHVLCALWVPETTFKVSWWCMHAVLPCVIPRAAVCGRGCCVLYCTAVHTLLPCLLAGMPHISTIYC
jgi:hypothetical protein